MLLNYTRVAVKIVFSCGSVSARNNLFWRSGDLKLTLCVRCWKGSKQFTKVKLIFYYKYNNPCFCVPLFSIVKQDAFAVRQRERRANIQWKNIKPDIYLYTEARKSQRSQQTVKQKLEIQTLYLSLSPRVVWAPWIFAVMESLKKKTGCMKVEDPYFGKRKPSTTLKRIHQKLSLLESQKKDEQVNQEHSSSTKPSSTRTVLSSLRENKQDEVKSRSNEELSRLTNTAMPRKYGASTAPRELSTVTLTKDPWPTKDEFETLLFRMIWASSYVCNSGVILDSYFLF